MKFMFKVMLLCLALTFCLSAYAQSATCTPPPGGHCVALTISASTTAGVTYNIYKSTVLPAGTVCTGVKILTGLTVLTASDNSVANGTTYYYQASAQNSGGESTCTNPVQVQIPIPPGPPANLSGTVL